MKVDPFTHYFYRHYMVLIEYSVIRVRMHYRVVTTFNIYTYFFAVGQNIFPNSIVCGVVPIFDENDWKLVRTFHCVKVCLWIVLCCIGLPKIALVAD